MLTWSPGLSVAFFHPFSVIWLGLGPSLIHFVMLPWMVLHFEKKTDVRIDPLEIGDLAF